MLVIDKENDRALLSRQSRFVPRMWSCLAGFMEVCCLSMLLTWCVRLWLTYIQLSRQLYIYFFAYIMRFFFNAIVDAVSYEPFYSCQGSHVELISDLDAIIHYAFFFVELDGVYHIYLFLLRNFWDVTCLDSIIFVAWWELGRSSEERNMGRNWDWSRRSCISQFSAVAW